MATLSKDIFVLAAGQALTSTVVSLLTSVSSLSGAYLAPSAALATVPVTATVLGTLLMIYPASALMARMGRRSGFMLKAALGIFGGAICCAGLVMSSFAVLILGAFLLGLFSAFGQYYRFAAIDAARSPAERTSAVSLVTGCGVIGGVLGPYLGSRFAGSFGSIPYAGAFLALALVCVVLAISQLLLSADLGLKTAADAPTSAPTRFTLGKGFYMASAICAIGFAVMTLVMNAAPLSIQHAGHGMHASALVLQAHFVLMYLPSFFNPLLVRWMGLRGLVATGIAAGVAGCLLTLWPEQTIGVYMVELGLSGIAWNFIFNGGTLLLTDTYPNAARARAQGLNSLFVYSANVLASFMAGVLLETSGWQMVNFVCLPLLACALLLICMRPRRTAALA